MSSVGWLGAIAAFLVLSVAGLASSNLEDTRGAYVAMDLATWALIVPLCFASFATGLVSSLGSTWGLVRHYWVVTKLVLSLAASAVLLLHTHPIGLVARAARAGMIGPADLHDVRVQFVADAGAALLVLLVNTALSIYKPRGTTRHAWRKQQGRRAEDAPSEGAASS